jgi:hypothetical protein
MANRKPIVLVTGELQQLQPGDKIDVSGMVGGAEGGSRGETIFRGVADWQVLAPGSIGHYLQTAGVGGDPSWAAAPAVGYSALILL